MLAYPTHGALDIPISPTVRWNSAAGASSYRLQVSDDSTFASFLKDTSGVTGTSFAVSGLSNSTKLFWRVNASNAGGTSGWSTVWSFTTVPPAPDVPILASPVNGATNVSLSSALSWSVSSGATSYTVQWSTDSTFVTTSSATTSSAWYDLSQLAVLTKYYWRVHASNAGGTSNWSTVWSFTTMQPPPPAAPILASPANGATNVSTSLTLSWNASTGATSYRLQVSADSTFPSFVKDTSGVADTSSTISGLSTSTMYYWRVNATNTGGTSGWSTVWSFTTIPPPPAASTVASPTDGAIDMDTSPVLSWNPASGATSYTLQWSTNSSFTGADSATISSTSYTVSGLLRSTTYYWRVRAENAGGSSSWSEIRPFTTLPSPPTVPTPIAPCN